MSTILHGECQITKVTKLPQGADRKEIGSEYQIVAESEVSGNHHVIDINDGVEFYEVDGKLFLKNTEETQVRCLIKERHDAITLDPGIWEIGCQQEYDYLTQEKRNVAD